MVVVVVVVVVDTCVMRGRGYEAEGRMELYSEWIRG